MSYKNATTCVAALTAAIIGTAVIAGPGGKTHGHSDEGGMAKPKTSAAPQDAGHGHGGGHGHAGSDATVGGPGKASDVRRTMRVTMRDNTYSPKSIRVQKGETVRFVVENKGEFVHEFNIGAAAMHAEHQKEMMAMMDSGALEADRIVHDKMGHMEHDDPNSVLLEPGRKGEVIWKFGKPGQLQFACNVPGHYEDGMHGRLTVR